MYRHNNEFYDMSAEEFVSRGILTEAEGNYLNTYRIPLGGCRKPLEAIWAKIEQAIDAGMVDKHEPAGITELNVYLQSDYLPGGEMLSHADGKHYTSKKKYIDAVEKSGGYIQEESRYTKIEKPNTFNDKKFDQSFKKALEQHGL